MMAASVLAVLPLIVLGTGAVLAMLLAPRARADTVRAAAGLALVVALAAALRRMGTPDLSSAMLVDDGLARLGQALVCATGLGTLAFLRPARPAREGPALVLLATLGAAVLCKANHAATLFLGLELATLSLIALFVLPLTRPALEAGYKLLILGGIGAATLLFALALTYAATGSLTLQAWAGRGMLVSLGTALLMAGLAFKFALAPFHMWTPDAFSGAPAAAAALAGTASKIGVAVVLVRLDAAGPPEPLWHMGLALIAGGSILLGNLQALRQTALPRMLGYSSVAQSGYVAAIVASGGAGGPTAVMFYLAGYAPALIAALCVAASLGPQARPEDLHGLAWRNPLMGAVLALALMSLAGLPISVGFFGKYYLFAALIRAGAWGLLAVAALGTGLGVYVYIRFLAAAFRTAPSSAPLPLPMAEGTVLVAGAAILLGLGLYPGPLIAALRLAFA
jgi:NADH-quinone oxidoreductase subunit N